MSLILEVNRQACTRPVPLCPTIIPHKETFTYTEQEAAAKRLSRFYNVHVFVKTGLETTNHSPMHDDL